MTEELKLRENAYLLPLQPTVRQPTEGCFAVLTDGKKDVYVPFEILADRCRIEGAESALCLSLDVFDVMGKVVASNPEFKGVYCTGVSVRCERKGSNLFWKNNPAVRFFGKRIRNNPKFSYV